ncbi:AAA family ATPase [Candidatus Woesearchaeota archaeon]|nr:AAA family ATPase [Candidatus Woesearchaeota archaeon]
MISIVTYNIIALVGLCGAGKTTVADILAKKGYGKIRFGEVTIDEIKKRGLLVNEQNERNVREELREQHGMAAYAILNLPKIQEKLAMSPVCIDGMYSWEEYLFLRESFKKNLVVLAVYTLPSLRVKRLNTRKERPLQAAEMYSRDKAEIENLNKAGPIALADYTLINNGSMQELEDAINVFLDGLDNIKNRDNNERKNDS